MKNELDKDYIVEYKETLAEYIDSEKFLSQLDLHVKDRSFSVFSLLDLFGQVFNKYSYISQRDWLISIFNWLNNKSFPIGIDGFDPKLTPYMNFYKDFTEDHLLEGVYQIDEFIQNILLPF